MAHRLLTPLGEPQKRTFHDHQRGTQLEEVISVEGKEEGETDKMLCLQNERRTKSWSMTIAGRAPGRLR